MAGVFVTSRRTRSNLLLAPALGGLLSSIAVAPFLNNFWGSRSVVDMVDFIRTTIAQCVVWRADSRHDAQHILPAQYPRFTEIKDHKRLNGETHIF